MGRTDNEQAKKAASISLENRQRLQQEARSGRRAHAQEPKRLEQQRLLDQQRQEIHPSHVQATLQGLPKPVPPPTSVQPKTLGLLPPAEPEEHPKGSKGVILPMRKWGEHA